MSSDRSFEEVWADQVAMAKAKGVEIPTELDPETARLVRDAAPGHACDGCCTHSDAYGKCRKLDRAEPTLETAAQAVAREYPQPDAAGHDVRALRIVTSHDLRTADALRAIVLRHADSPMTRQDLLLEVEALAAKLRGQP